MYGCQDGADIPVAQPVALNSAILFIGEKDVFTMDD